jgi:hypothetical protein
MASDNCKWCALARTKSEGALGRSGEAFLFLIFLVLFVSRLREALRTGRQGKKNKRHNGMGER